MNAKMRNDGSKRKAGRKSFETGDVDDQQIGTSQAQKGEGRKPD
jgi:hypothetical protein